MQGSSVLSAYSVRPYEQEPGHPVQRRAAGIAAAAARHRKNPLFNLLLSLFRSIFCPFQSLFTLLYLDSGSAAREISCRAGL